MKAHAIGIAGVGMSATALLLKEAGWEISGSDAEAYGPPREILERGGIPFATGYDPGNIPEGVDCFLIGRNAKLAPEENAEVRAALATGKPHYSFPEMLGKLSEGRRNVVVAGSYGKSTTTALIAHILRHAGIDAGYFIGAEPVQTASLPFPAAIGSAKEFVLEGDEYPSAHDDPRAKFLHLRPTDVVLTSLVHDHINVYPTFAEYQKPFHDLLALVPEDGVVIVSADEPGALALAKASGKKLFTYGLKNADADLRAGDITFGEITRFTLFKNGERLGEIETTQLGAHNVENITAAAAYVLTRDVAFKKIAGALKDFKGVRRRLDNITPRSKVPVFEGFGSSYEKARSAIKAIKLHYPKKKLVVVFEPHTFGWRNRANLTWYDDVFSGAHEVFIAAPESQGAGTHDQLSHTEIIERAASSGVNAQAYAGPADVVAALSGDEVVLILTSGDLHGTLPVLAKAIEEKYA